MNMNDLQERCKRKSDYLITMFVTNKFALWLTYLMLPTKITPNQVTLMSLLCSLLCAGLYAGGSFLLGSFFLFLSHVLDCTDGNLARAKKLFSPHGQLLDMICDRVGESVLFIAVAYYLYVNGGEMAYLALVDGLLLMLYYYIVDISLSAKAPVPGEKRSNGGVVIDGVRLKWGIMEPVIYGFILFSTVGLLRIQIHFILVLIIVGLLYQLYKTARLIRSGSLG